MVKYPIKKLKSLYFILENCYIGLCNIYNKLNIFLIIFKLENRENKIINMSIS